MPRRASLRLQNKTPEGLELPPESVINRAAFYYVPVEPVDHVSLYGPENTLKKKKIHWILSTDPVHKERLLLKEKKKKYQVKILENG